MSLLSGIISATSTHSGKIKPATHGFERLSIPNQANKWNNEVINHRANYFEKYRSQFWIPSNDRVPVQLLQN